MKYLLVALTLFVIAGPAQAEKMFEKMSPKMNNDPGVPAPAPGMDLGIAGLAMVAGAAFLAHRRRRY